MTKILLALTAIWAIWGMVVDSNGLPVKDQVIVSLVLTVITVIYGIVKESDKEGE